MPAGRDVIRGEQLRQRSGVVEFYGRIEDRVARLPGRCAGRGNSLCRPHCGRLLHSVDKGQHQGDARCQANLLSNRTHAPEYPGVRTPAMFE